jgi:arylsulfatase A-like enzyme/Flp pilus assembly protein TadD
MLVFGRLLWVLLLGECALAAATTRPNLILITLDTTRADRMGFLGSSRALTPNLDALARQSVVFTRAYAHVPLTTASHATILTGTYPQFNHVNDFGVPLPEGVPDLPEILRTHGYQTAAFVSSLILDPIEGAAPGFDRGFNTYDAGFHIRGPGQNRYNTIERRAGAIVARALAWLDRHPRGPFFLWLHLYDAHDPYDPPEPFKSRYVSAPYDGEIAYADSAVGRFFTQLRARRLYDGALIAVMADHGEALGEHGELAHGIFLYDETIHVPLLFKMPGEQFAGKRISTRVGLVDVLPTILQTVGAPIPQPVQGESLVSMMKARAKAAADREATIPDHVAYAESDYPHKAFGWSSLRALRAGKYLFIQAPRKELYDQSADPKAEHNLSYTAAPVSDTLAGQLEAFRQKTSSAKPVPKADVNPQAQEKLSALGYLASDNGSDNANPHAGVKNTGADPKDKIEIVNLLHDAILDVEDARYKEAIPLLEQVLAKEPVPLAYVQLGTAFSWLKDYDKALPVLRKAVELRPDLTMAHYELGLALFNTGDLQRAAPEMEAAVAISPRWVDLHFSLAAVYARIDRMPDARKELETTIVLKPDHFRAHLMLGRMFTLQGEPLKGLPNLKKAVRLQPNSPQAHLFLADAYAQLGQEANAGRERAEADRVNPTRRP